MEETRAADPPGAPGAPLAGGLRQLLGAPAAPPQPVAQTDAEIGSAIGSAIGDRRAGGEAARRRSASADRAADPEGRDAADAGAQGAADKGASDKRGADKGAADPGAADPGERGAVEAWALPSGALWFPGPRALAAADLHLGKSERSARRGGPFLPPYEIDDTLARLEAQIGALAPETVICLGDSFDDARCADGLSDAHRARLATLTATRRWVWIAGNHDPAPPTALGGEAAAEARLGPVTLRHAATQPAPSGEFEISGHYHPKATLIARGRRLSRRCFLLDRQRLILPAFGAFTGGLDAADPVFDALVGAEAVALMTGRAVRAAPRRALIAPHAPPNRRTARRDG